MDTDPENNTKDNVEKKTGKQGVPLRPAERETKFAMIFSELLYVAWTKLESIYYPIENRKISLYFYIIQ